MEGQGDGKDQVAEGPADKEVRRRRWDFFSLSGVP